MDRQGNGVAGASLGSAAKRAALPPGAPIGRGRIRYPCG